jgi:tetratricopeptide (TPR) repeat protein
VTELHLEPLSRTSTVDLVRSRLGTAALSPRVQALVAEKAEGNPLFAEELATYLHETAPPPGAEATTAHDFVLPTTLENLLMDRIGRLPDGPRAVLQAAAVVGRRFSVDLVRRVSQRDGAVAEWLCDLERQEFVFREPDRDEFSFKHALLRDAVYQNLLKARREELHERTASALEATHAERLEEVADALADHYARTRQADRAVRYLTLAGERSLALYSLDEAESRFRHALELIRTVPGCADDAFLADVLLKIARVYYFRADLKNSIALVEEYLPRIEALGDKRRLSRFLFETGYAHVFAARQDVGKPLLERALALGEEIGDEEAIGYACMGLMWYYVFWAPPGPDRRATVERLGSRALLIGRRTQDVWLASKTLLCLANDASVWGRPNEAVHLGQQLLQLSEDTGDPRPKGMGLFQLAFHSAYSYEFDAALEYAESGLRSSVSPVDRLFGRLAKATALALSGQGDESLARLKELRQQAEAGEFRISGLFCTDVPYGLGLVSAGALAEGVRWIESAAERYAAWGQPFARGYRHAVLGQIYLKMAQGGPRPPLAMVLRNLGFLIRAVPFAGRRARRHLEAAVREFRRLDIPFSLAESLFHLALLHQAKGRSREARACLEEARAVAAAMEASPLCERIDAARASLEP